VQKVSAFLRKGLKEFADTSGVFVHLHDCPAVKRENKRPQPSTAYRDEFVEMTYDPLAAAASPSDARAIPFKRKLSQTNDCHDGICDGSSDRDNQQYEPNHLLLCIWS